MKRDVAALFLLGGWIVITPPSRLVEVEGFLVNEQVPVQMWQHEASFDSAKECENFRSEMITLYATSRKDPKGSEPKTAKAMAQAWRLSRCIPAEHLYPPR